MTVDELFDDIPPDVRKAAETFSQGDVLERIPIAYFLVAKSAITLGARDESDAGELSLHERDIDDGFAYGLITTQTCDIVEEDSTVARKPWVQVSPVYLYEGLSAERIAAISAFHSPDLARLTAPRFEDGLWVVDLRLSIPIEKSVLVGRQPIPGFANETDAKRFADHCSAYINRPVLPGVIHEHVVKHINNFFGKRPNLRSTLLACKVTAFRLNVSATEGYPIVRVVVFTDDLSFPNVAAIEKVLKAWFDAAVDLAGYKKRRSHFSCRRSRRLPKLVPTSICGRYRYAQIKFFHNLERNTFSTRTPSLRR